VKLKNGIMWIQTAQRLTIIQLKMLIIKLTDRTSKASLRDNPRYGDSKSIVMVGSASVSSDNATVNTETIKPTQRVQKNEHKMMTFLPRKMLDTRMQQTET
jgi:hypothetical protein